MGRGLLIMLATIGVTRPVASIGVVRNLSNSLLNIERNWFVLRSVSLIERSIIFHDTRTFVIFSFSTGIDTRGKKKNAVKPFIHVGKSNGTKNEGDKKEKS